MQIDVNYFSISRIKPIDRYGEGSTLAGVIYVHRISDNRFGGITGRNFNLFRKLCGESTLKNVVLVTNVWDEDPRDIDEAREEEPSNKLFKPALDKGAQMVRHHSTTESAYDILRRVMGNRPAVLQIQRELIGERKDIADTAAEESVNSELREQVRRHRVELKELREMTQAPKYEETWPELDEQRGKLQEWMEKVTKDEERTVANHVGEEGEARVPEMEQKVESGEKRPQDLVDVLVTTPLDELVHHDNFLPRTTVTELIDRRQRLSPPLPPLTPYVPNLQIPPLVTSYARVLFCLATHDD